MKGPYSGERGAHERSLFTERTDIDASGNPIAGRKNNLYGLADPRPDRGERGSNGDKGSAVLPKGKR